MILDEQRVMLTEQYKQWERLGLIEIALDYDETYLKWTPKAKSFTDLFTLRTLFDAVLGKPHQDLDRRLWKNFDKDGFALVDEE